jgi:hypothetical protein
MKTTSFHLFVDCFIPCMRSLLGVEKCDYQCVVINDSLINYVCIVENAIDCVELVFLFVILVTQALLCM